MLGPEIALKYPWSSVCMGGVIFPSDFLTEVVSPLNPGFSRWAISKIFIDFPRGIIEECSPLKLEVILHQYTDVLCVVYVDIWRAFIVDNATNLIFCGRWIRCFLVDHSFAQKISLFFFTDSVLFTRSKFIILWQKLRRLVTLTECVWIRNPHISSSLCGTYSSKMNTISRWASFWIAFDSAKNHKRQRRKRQSVTAKREKSQTPKFV